MTMSPFASTVFNERYAWLKTDGSRETWKEVAQRVAWNVMGAVRAPVSLIKDIEELIATRVFIPGGRYLYGAGRPFHQVQNCLLLRAEDSREGWGELLNKATLALMTGAGIGVVYSDLRAEGVPLKRTGGYSSGPLALMQAVNEVGRAAKQGGNRRAAIWAGLHWNHPDIMRFINLKDWSPEIRTLKEKDFNFSACMDHTNISVILDDDFFTAYAAGDSHALEVYWYVVSCMMQSGEPGFSVDVGVNQGENLRNACTEITSRDDSDICNLGSINLAKIESPTQMRAAVDLATAFLVAGTVYSDVPYPKVAEVRAQNRRLGLGLMGMHEFVAARGRYYGDTEDLRPYFVEYERSGDHAAEWTDRWSLSPPLKTRAIAPTGTIGIVAETTTGIEPIFCSAYRRRYYDHGTWRSQCVIDPTARRLVESGVQPWDIEDAYTITAERRVAFQAVAQQFVDHGISSTINLPAWGSDGNNEDTVQPFGEMLMKYLPQIRGITCYPDGARGGQPLTRIDFEDALTHEGEILTEGTDVCDIRGGSCGA